MGIFEKVNLTKRIDKLMRIKKKSKHCKMTEISVYPSAITLNVNGFYFWIKRYRQVD
jgi:hypothetical protein